MPKYCIYSGPVFLRRRPSAPLYPHRTLWRYTNAVLLLLLSR